MKIRQAMQEFKTNGFRYRFIKRKGDVAMYEVLTKQGINTGFEVYRIRIVRVNHNSAFFRDTSWQEFDFYEKLPSNEDFGMYGWYFQSREYAEKRYEEMTNEEKS